MEEPVVSKLSGHVFEKRLIQKHIDANGLCPITNQDLSLSDLIPI
jgi:pre-mRNA-processing factor 19